MRLGLIICTFQRPVSLIQLLETVEMQEYYPEEIIIVDSSFDNRTSEELEKHPIKALRYFKVEDEYRGLTRQRNFGVEKISPEIEIICFLDDDTLLDPAFFKEIARTYKEFPEAVGVSGCITNETEWKQTGVKDGIRNGYFHYDGWSRKEGFRFRLRRRLGLAPTAPPGYMPDFSHGYSTGFLPPSGKTYEVEMLMGGITSYKKELFQNILFSTYFSGYGLYEDADFSLRASRIGKLFVNTKARVEHHHSPEGRPDFIKYGKMVVRNGWYVWKTRHQNPSLRAQVKWHATSMLLTLIRFSNALNSHDKISAAKESWGRVCGWWSLIFKKPDFQKINGKE